jgi:hypothetical protein
VAVLRPVFRCEFIKKQVRKGDEVYTSKHFYGTKRTYQSVTDYYYNYEMDFEFHVFRGNDPEKKVRATRKHRAKILKLILKKHTGTCELIVSDNDQPPRGSVRTSFVTTTKLFKGCCTSSY